MHVTRHHGDGWADLRESARAGRWARGLVEYAERQPLAGEMAGVGAWFRAEGFAHGAAVVVQLLEGKGEPCKRGERADRTGCIPASQIAAGKGSTPRIKGKLAKAEKEGIGEIPEIEGLPSLDVDSINEEIAAIEAGDPPSEERVKLAAITTAAIGVEAADDKRFGAESAQAGGDTAAAMAKEAGYEPTEADAEVITSILTTHQDSMVQDPGPQWMETGVRRAGAATEWAVTQGFTTAGQMLGGAAKYLGGIGLDGFQALVTSAPDLAFGLAQMAAWVVTAPLSLPFLALVPAALGGIAAGAFAGSLMAATGVGSMALSALTYSALGFIGAGIPAVALTKWRMDTLIELQEKDKTAEGPGGHNLFWSQDGADQVKRGAGKLVSTFRDARAIRTGGQTQNAKDNARREMARRNPDGTRGRLAASTNHHRTTEGKGEPCKRGERADRTGCIPASQIAAGKGSTPRIKGDLDRAEKEGVGTLPDLEGLELPDTETLSAMLSASIESGGSPDIEAKAAAVADALGAEPFDEETTAGLSDAMTGNPDLVQQAASVDEGQEAISESMEDATTWLFGDDTDGITFNEASQEAAASIIEMGPSGLESLAAQSLSVAKGLLRMVMVPLSTDFGFIASGAIAGIPIGLWAQSAALAAGVGIWPSIAVGGALALATVSAGHAILRALASDGSGEQGGKPASARAAGEAATAKARARESRGRRRPRRRRTRHAQGAMA